jgi:translation initiation factor 4G
MATSASHSGPGVDGESPEIVERKVRGLLNKLTMTRFDSISDQIIAWADKSEREKDGRVLMQVIKLIFEMATDEEKCTRACVAR